MDQRQTDHLKAYGIAFLNLKKSIDIEWLLNYRGGSFLIDDNVEIKTFCTVRGVSFELIDAVKLSEILTDIEANNMDIILLEKEPKIAVYSPPDNQENHEGRKHVLQRLWHRGSDQILFVRPLDFITVMPSEIYQYDTALLLRLIYLMWVFGRIYGLT